MRALIALGMGLAWAAAGQVEKPVEPPAPKPVLQNTGKSMLLDFRCTDEDIRLAGLSCTLDDPCPMFLELDAVEAVGNRLFLAGNIHTATTTFYAVLLASDDNGKTWRELGERLRASALDRIQFVDFQNGWISGEALFPLPHDPFFLVTSDGGETWHSQALFGEPQFGSIVQFSFNSKTNGSVVLDRGRGGESGRYALLETQNGGETWSLRQSADRPPQIRRISGTGNADWRLRADAATKAYRVEHKTAEGWRSVAAFSVSLGMCKPPEPPAPESAPPPQN